MIDRLRSDLKEAMRRQEAVVTSTIRMLISQFQYARVQAGRDLTEEDGLQILQRAVKTRREAIAQYESAGRTDLAEKERAEIAVVERYLPAAMTPEEVERAVDLLLQEMKPAGPKDLGRVMKEFMSRHRGRVDGKAVNALLASRLR